MLISNKIHYFRNFLEQKYKMHKSRTLTKNGYSMSKKYLYIIIVAQLCRK